ncbi:Triosephosphate isomerase [Sporormia fimetaria CBS 119925]|uniref:Triosephosphate isomerase n=1 Tax=Sporormia fimetaria CBS 119925 TaxID=1340428 RepID=A0A6A6VB48_9PLEO|nr:Triosephosphate isomerase [Sporormia fimetaria CBS 119925]
MPPLPTRPLIGISLKTYLDLPTTLSYTHGLLSLDPLAFNARTDLFLIPDHLTLHPCASILAPSHILLGAQDTHWEDHGPYTGCISPLVLSQLGVRIVEIGHAERRTQFGETDEIVSKKAAAVVRNGMVPLVCVGERRKESAASAAVGRAVEECKPQVMSVLKAIPEDAQVVFAYEPVWAIGADKPADKDHVVMVAREIKRMAVEGGRKGRVRVLYGGAAGPGTWEGVKEGVDGLFLGRFAHDIKNLKKVLEEVGGS